MSEKDFKHSTKFSVLFYKNKNKNKKNLPLKDFAISKNRLENQPLLHNKIRIMKHKRN
jgi:hypothetical protein